MEKILQKLKELHNIDLDLKAFTKLELFKSPSQDPFNEFIVRNRLIPFLKLKILTKIKEDTFYAARDSTSYTEFDEDLENQNEIQKIKIHNQVCTQTFSQQEIWDYILHLLSISQIITPHFIDIETLPFKSTEDNLLPKLSEVDTNAGSWSVQPSDLIFITKNHILTDTHLFIKDPKQFTQLIFQHEQEWKEFLLEEHFTIDHETYINYLLKTFPDKIKIRMLN